MTASPLKATREQVYQLVMIPIIAVVVTSIFLLLCSGMSAFRSVLLGGLGWVLPNLYFVYKVFANVKVGQIKAIPYRFYQAEIIKICLLGIWVVIAIRFLAVTIGAFLLGFVIAQLTFWVLSIIFYSKKR